MMKNIEKGPYFVDPPEKAEAMAYAEKIQREGEDKRRERAGLSVNPDIRNDIAEKEGRKWEQVQQLTNEYIESSIPQIERFLTDHINDNKELRLSAIGSNMIHVEEVISAVSEKMKAYLGDDFPNISFEYAPNETGYNHTFILRKKESQEE